MSAQPIGALRLLFGTLKGMSTSTPEPNNIEEPGQKKTSKGPHDPNEINPKLTSDIHYWAEEFNVTGQQLHEAIRVHGTKVSKVREALKHHKS